MLRAKLIPLTGRFCPFTSRPSVSNTHLQVGGRLQRLDRSRFSVSSVGHGKTVETVWESLRGRDTLLKKGVNEKTASRALLVFVLVAALALAVTAAPARGRVEGSVTDPSGAKVIGARVSLRDTAGLIAYQARSDDEGHFAINDVAAGRYHPPADAVAERLLAFFGQSSSR